MAAGDLVSIRGQVMESTLTRTPSSWNTHVLHNLPSNTVQITCHLELAYQFVLSSRHSPGINLKLFPSIHSFHNSLVAPFINSLVTPSLLCVHEHSLLIDEDGRACRNISIEFPCVVVCISFSDLFNL